MKIKMIHVISGLEIGGAELVLKRLILAQQEQGKFEHIVISLTSKGPIGQQLEEAGIQVVSLNISTWMDSLKCIWTLKKLMQQHRADIIQTWMYHADFFGGIAARLAGINNIIWAIRCADITTGSTKSARFLRKPSAFLSRFIPKSIVCVAEESKRFHVSLGYCEKKMTVIHNGFDLATLSVSPEEMSAFQTKLGLNKNDIIIGIVGRFNPDKDYANFIKAATLAAKKYESHTSIKFILIGNGLDNNNKVLTEWINQTGIPDKFILLGQRTDIPLCISAMDVFCLSSRTEGLPSVIGEAMALNVPCVATNVGDTATLIGDTGIIVPPENVEELAKGIITMLSYPPEKRMHLGQLAHKRIEEEFSLDIMVKKYEALYLSTLKIAEKGICACVD